jgi:putative membrane protein
MRTTVTLIFFLAGCLFINAQPSARDQKFIEEASQSNLLEIKLGELAQAKAGIPEVKTLGQQMMTDHSKSNIALTALAARQNATVSVTLNEKAQSTYDALAEKQGADFDKAYTKCMVSDHKKDIRMFKKEAKKGDDIDLKGFASATVKVLQHHKQMAKDARKALKKHQAEQVSARLVSSGNR